nr:cell division cycle 5-like protein [Tanacetum cinerariifolium]
MNLPTPQIPDYELEHIAKFGLPALSEELSEGSGATRALLADYTQTPRHGMTPLRTPQRTPAGKQDAIMMEAENQARLRLSQTPLLGGENPDLHPSDFSGVTPKKKEIQTPNLMLTPSVMSTPGASGLTPRIGMTPRDACPRKLRMVFKFVGYGSLEIALMFALSIAIPKPKTLWLRTISSFTMKIGCHGRLVNDGWSKGGFLCNAWFCALGPFFLGSPLVKLLVTGHGGAGKCGSCVLIPDLVVMAKVGASGIIVLTESCKGRIIIDVSFRHAYLLGWVVLLTFISLMGSSAVIANQVALLLRWKRRSWRVMVRPKDRLGTGRILLFDYILLLKLREAAHPRHPFCASLFWTRKVDWMSWKLFVTGHGGAEKGAARRWLEKEPPHSIHTWEDIVSKFINGFIPPSRTTNLRNEISNFQQWFDESFHEAWDRYKDLLRACPHHGFTELHQLDTFYNVLNPADQDSLNTVVGGNLLERRTQDVLTIIENKFKVRNSQNKSVVSQVKSCDANSNSSSEIAKLTHAVNQQTSAVTTAMTAILKQFQATPPPASVKAVEEICVTCGGAHPYYQCLAAGGNTFPELRDNIQGYVLAAAINYNQGNSVYRPSASLSNQNNEIKNMMASLFQMSIASTLRSGSLPSNTVANPKGELKAITTRSGLVLDGPTVPTPPPFINPNEDERVEETLTDPDLFEYTIKVPPPPIQKYKPPSQRDYVVHQRDPLHPNIPYPSKIDPGKFLISCGFSELKCKALADLGASINLMPLSVWKKLGLPELISTHITLELTNRVICTPAEIARDVFVPVGKFTFPANFVIVDYESDPRVPLILGRPFLRPTRALIDVHEFLLHQDIDSSLKDSIDQSNLANLADNFVDSMTEMLTDEHARDYSSPPIFDEYDDDFLEVESDTENVYDDPFDSKGEKIKESKLLIDELDLPCDFLPPSEYDSFISQDFSRVDSLPSTNNEDKIFNPGILSQEKPFEVITRVVQDKKLSTSNASLVLDDFDPPLYEPLFFKEVLRSKMLLPFSSENKEKVFKPGIHTS